MKQEPGFHFDNQMIVDTLLIKDPIKPYHIKKSILPKKELLKRVKQMDKNVDLRFQTLDEMDLTLVFDNVKSNVKKKYLKK